MASFFNRFTSVLRPSIVLIMNHTEFRRYQKTDSILTWSMLPCFFLLCYNWHWPINVLQLPSDYVVARVRSVACGKKKNISCLKTWLATLKKISTPRKNCNGNHQAKPNWKWSKQGEIDQIVFPKSWVATYSKVTKCWLQNVQSVGYLCLFRPSFFY